MAIRLVVFLLVSWKVNDLLAKKLNTIATEVDTKLLATVGNPNVTSANNMPKSIAVFNPPIITKRIFSALFFNSSSTMMFLNEIKWALFGFVKYSSNIFANHTQ